MFVYDRSNITDPLFLRYIGFIEQFSNTTAGARLEAAPTLPLPERVSNIITSLFGHADIEVTRTARGYVHGCPPPKSDDAWHLPRLADSRPFHMRLRRSGTPGEFLGSASGRVFEHNSVFRYKGMFGGSPYFFSCETTRMSPQGVTSTLHGAAFFHNDGTLVTLVYDHRSHEEWAFKELPQRFQEFSEWRPRLRPQPRYG